MEKNHKNAEVRYTAGTRNGRKDLAECPHFGTRNNRRASAERHRWKTCCGILFDL